MGYGMHRDKFGISRGSNPIGFMEMVSYLPTRMGLVSYFDTGLIFTTLYYYLIILLVTWSHILWIHRLHRIGIIGHLPSIQVDPEAGPK